MEKVKKDKCHCSDGYVHVGYNTMPCQDCELGKSLFDDWYKLYVRTKKDGR